VTYVCGSATVQQLSRTSEVQHRLTWQQCRSPVLNDYSAPDLNGFYNINKGLFFDLVDGGRRGHEKKLFKRRFRLDTRKFVFRNRVVDNWNSLSAQCVNSCTSNTFKKHVSV